MLIWGWSVYIACFVAFYTPRFQFANENAGKNRPEIEGGAYKVGFLQKFIRPVSGGEYYDWDKSEFRGV